MGKTPLVGSISAAAVAAIVLSTNFVLPVRAGPEPTKIKKIKKIVKLEKVKANTPKKPIKPMKGFKALTPDKEKPQSGSLKIRNRTPFIVVIYVAKVRIGWVKPFRTEVFKGLKEGKHKVSAVSHYGSAYWEPRIIHVPGMWNLIPGAGVKNSDMETALVLRIYRRNRNSLVACDRLAERRGEDLRGGRADFEVKVSTEGKGKVKVIGDDLSKRLKSCYRAVATHWEYPSTGVPYTVEFQHLH